MSNLVLHLDERWYPDAQNNWDDELFRKRILRSTTSESVVLELGAGAGIVEQMNFRGMVARICGVDPDERILDNSFLDEAKIGVGESIPYADQIFDLVFADNVLEHLEKPRDVFVEVARVLKPGGRFVFKTPNACHYMPLIAQLTPLRFHKFINRIRGRDVEDSFPTRYRANNERNVVRLAVATGFEIAELQFIEGRPEYMRISAMTYVFGFVYERIVNSTSKLKRFRVLLIGDLVRT